MGTRSMRAPEKYYLPEGTIIVGDAGRAGLWVAFACMAVPCLWFWHKASKKPAGQRKFEYLSFTINAIASLAYLTMACGYGATAINGQQFFFARYIDWSLTTPLMLVGGLIGALQSGHGSSWIFFCFSMFFFVPIFYYLLFDNEFKEKIVASYKDVYTKAAWLTAIVWCGYPIVWVLHEGTKSLSLDTAVIIYLILDTLAKSVWGFIITMGRESVESKGEAVPTMQMAEAGGSCSGSVPGF